MSEEQIKKLKKERKAIRIVGIALLVFGWCFTMIIFQIFPPLIAIGSVCMFIGFFLTLRSFAHVKYEVLRKDNNSDNNAQSSN